MTHNPERRPTHRGNNKPFRMKCTLCGTTAESWHYAAKAPKGATKGRASCECGNITVDSLGYKNLGRVFEKQSGTAEGVE
ncbi:hypothetical protein [Celeribacter baekdonensis]|uniref:hypothetical protein n=1 Tax=Celeribacter baekdonensis TaxID=875171 RepID=UPI0026ED4FC2|nr:hypothetical protein [Celeribacter baekdonensis]|tara:strand:+ start:1771 stop:2010 length:240 start_codon:yes stop_codon:yes gene_type:complete